MCLHFLPYLLNICKKFAFLICQASVATYLRWGGCCRMGFVANFIHFPAAHKFWESVKIWQSYREFKGGTLFETLCSGVGMKVKLDGDWYKISRDRCGSCTPLLSTESLHNTYEKTFVSAVRNNSAQTHHIGLNSTVFRLSVLISFFLLV